jgi:hypothetical protein
VPTGQLKPEDSDSALPDGVVLDVEKGSSRQGDGLGVVGPLEFNKFVPRIPRCSAIVLSERASTRPWLPNSLESQHTFFFLLLRALLLRVLHRLRKTLEDGGEGASFATLLAGVLLTTGSGSATGVKIPTLFC